MLTILYTDEMKCMSILFNEAVADPGIVSQNNRCNLIIKCMIMYNQHHDEEGSNGEGRLY